MPPSHADDAGGTREKRAKTGRVLGGYQLVRKLGTGGMGVVWEAWDATRGRQVALKTLRDVDPTALYRFKREFRAMADVNHPNLVQLFELAYDAGQWFFTMELVDGVNLLAFARDSRAQSQSDFSAFAGTEVPDMPTQRMPAAGPLTAPEQFERLRQAMLQLGSALIGLHEAGMVHRDVKPSNVLVTPERRTVLLDFGLVTDTVSGGAETDHAVVGTAVYMAPEQAASKPVGPAADWYSFGVLLYEALTGHRPFIGAPLQILMDKQRIEPPPPSMVEGAEDVPPDLDKLCAQLLVRDPAARPTPEHVLSVLGGSTAMSMPVTQSFSLAPPFVGRTNELARLRDVYEHRGDGVASAAFVIGESGVGKSALVRQFVDRVRGDDRDAIVLEGRCYQRESVPYKAFDGIIDALSHKLRTLDQVDAALLLPHDAVLLARLFPVLGRVPAVARMPDVRNAVRNRHHLRSRSFSALRELLSRLSDRSPLVLVVDDFQWADADSLALLSEVLHPPDAPPLTFVATVRRDAGDDEVAHVAEVVKAVGSAEMIEIGALSRVDAVELARSLFERSAAPAGVDPGAVADEAGGHPLFIDEIVRHVATADGPLPAASRLDDALWARVSRLEPEARRLLELAAVSGVPLALETAADAAHLDLATCSRWCSVLRVSNLVRNTGGRQGAGIEPYHDRVRESVLANLDGDTRQRHHRNLAEALFSAGAATTEPLVLVRHLEGAGYKARAAAQATQAARRASDALAFEQAAELYKTALALGNPSPTEERTLRLALAEALTNAGRGFEAAEAFLLVAEGADTAMRLECQRRAAEQFLLNGHLERGFEALDTVLAHAGESMPATPRRALASVLWHRFRVRLRGLRFTPHDESEISPRTLRQLDVYNAVATSMGMVDNIRGADFQARAMLGALRCGERMRIGRSFASEAMFMATQGGRKMVRAERLLAEAKALAKETKDPFLRAYAIAAEGIVAYFQGRFSFSVEAMHEAEVRFRDHATGAFFELSSARIFRVLSLRMLGRFADMSSCAARFMRDAQRRGDRYCESTLRCAFNGMWLMRGDLDRARTELASDLWTPPDNGYHLQHWYQMRSRAELAMYAGAGPDESDAHAESFAKLESSLLLRVQVIRVENRWLRSRLALAECDAGADLRSRRKLVERDARDLLKERLNHATASAHMLLGGVALVDGDAEAALAHYTEAIAVSDEGELAMFAAASRRRRGEILGGDDGATLIAEGDGYMASQGVVDPERMARMIAPGLPRSCG